MSFCISWKKLLQILILKWAKIVRINWSHHFMNFWNNRTVILVHSNQDLPIWTLHSICKDLKIENIEAFTKNT